VASVLIIDSDPIARDFLHRAFLDHDDVKCVVADPERGTEIFAAGSRGYDGLLVNVEPAGIDSGWRVARLARETNPDIAIGYLSTDGLADWAAYGVPDSALINVESDPDQISSAFLQFCRSSRRMLDQAHQSTVRWAVGSRNKEPSRRKVLIAEGKPHRAERDELHNVLMQAPGFVAWLDGPDHRFAFANMAYRRLVEREVLGERVIDVIPEAEAQGYIDILDRIYRSGEPLIVKAVSTELILPDGICKHAFLDLNYCAVRTASGAVSGIIVTGEDVTEQHRARQRIGTLQNDLFHVSRINAMGMMVSTIAHELNQPLATIHNYVTVAKTMIERGGAKLRTLEALQGAASAALRAGEIIRNLRLMTTRREMVREPVPLEETLREAAGLATLGQPAANVEFDVQSPITVQGDKILIQQVLFNIVRNAIEAAGGETVSVKIQAAERQAVVEVCVSDTGPGIDKALLPSVFDAFVTSKADGTGIGLSISKAIIEAHGGEMSARNGLEGGAIFCFTLARAA
jgi:two-component system sensor kinase FixL